MDGGRRRHSPGTAVLKRARDLRQISQNLAGIVQEWPAGEIFRDFSLNFTPVRRQRDVEEEEQAAAAAAAEAREKAEAEAREAAAEAEAKRQEAEAAAVKEAEERARMNNLLESVQSLHTKVNESTTTLAELQTDVSDKDRAHLEQEKKVRKFL